MTGLGGLNRSPEGVVIGLVQLQPPVVATKTDLAFYRVPWEDEVKVVDGTSCGFPPPERTYVR